jgi:hypothetical protein
VQHNVEDWKKIRSAARDRKSWFTCTTRLGFQEQCIAVCTYLRHYNLPGARGAAVPLEDKRVIATDATPDNIVRNL